MTTATCSKMLALAGTHFGSYPCGKRATVKVGRRWYCRRHDPSSGVTVRKAGRLRVAYNTVPTPPPRMVVSAKGTKRKVRCWQCGSRLNAQGHCPKDCGPEELGKLLTF